MESSYLSFKNLSRILSFTLSTCIIFNYGYLPFKGYRIVANDLDWPYYI